MDWYGEWTIGISVNLEAFAFLGVSGSIGIFIDGYGNIDFQESHSVLSVDDTVAAGFLSAGAGAALQYTNCDTVYDLYGPAMYIGASGNVAPIVSVGGDFISFSSMHDPKAQIDGVQITGGVGIGVDIHIVEAMTKHIGSEPASVIYPSFAPTLYPTFNYSGSGSIVHVSSSGRTHGEGGGKF